MDLLISYIINYTAIIYIDGSQIKSYNNIWAELYSSAKYMYHSYSVYVNVFAETRGQRLNIALFILLS